MAGAADDSRRLLGDFIRAQRQMANLSLRQLSALAEVSNPYLSQVERGLHEPSVRVLRSIADALNVSAETLLEQAGLLDADKNDTAGGEKPTERPSGRSGPTVPSPSRSAGRCSPSTAATSSTTPRNSREPRARAASRELLPLHLRRPPR